jgi:ssDNA-binding Zn-finger/Zn-ribbon topoisomerase 1
MPLSFNPERARCPVCGQRCRLWGNRSGQRMVGCATCDVHEIDEFLADSCEHEQRITAADDERFLATLRVGW